MSLHHHQRRAGARIALVLLALLVPACGVQLGGAARRTRDPGRTRGALEAAGRIHRARASGPYGGWAATLTSSDDQLVRVRALTLGAGYRIVAEPGVRFEVGPELGFGEPVAIDYPSTGLFAGGAAAVLVRLPLWGEQHDNLSGVAPIGYALDLVLTGRGGRWTRSVADGGAGQWELGGELGLRFTFFSDLIVASDDAWEGPWDAD